MSLRDRLAAVRDPRRRPWRGVARPRGAARGCNVCGWRGEAFGGVPHSESAVCPSCGSIARDRFLFECFLRRVPYRRGLRVLETSPRLGEDYRAAMRAVLDYRASDFDERAHRADLRLDLQRLDLPDASLDVLLSPHVLEHVPDPEAALAEIARVLSPGGRALVQVPLLQAATAPPAAPELHQDETPVHWRFGLDLTRRMRAHGLETVLLVTADLRRRALARDVSWPWVSPEVDAPAIVRALVVDDLVVVAGEAASRRLGLEPSYMFVTWEGVRR